MPDDFDRLLEVAKLDRGDVGQVVVPLRRVVVQPLDDVVDARAVDDDRRLAPHDVGALDRRRRTVAGARPPTDSPRRRGCGTLLRRRRRGASLPSALPAMTGVKPLLTGRNASDERSSRTAPTARRSPMAAMYSWLLGSGSISLRSDLSLDALAVDFLLEHHDAVHETFGARRTARDVDVDRDDACRCPAPPRSCRTCRRSTRRRPSRCTTSAAASAARCGAAPARA